MSDGSATPVERKVAEGAFAGLGRFVVRFRWFVVAAWIAAAAIIPQVLPSLSSAVKEQNTSFLPKDTPVVRAQELAVPFEARNAAATLLVGGIPGRPLDAGAERAFTAAEHAVARLRGVLDVRDRGASADRQVRMALVELSGSGARMQGTSIFSRMRSAVRDAGGPPGFQAHFAGELASSVDTQSQQQHNQDLTQKLSILFILLLLLVVFRAVLAPVVTLLPAALALVIAGPLIGEAAKAGLEVSGLTQLILIVIVLGAGTDYGLFLIFRVREEMAHGVDPRQAVRIAVSRVGETITFSALTVIVALVAVVLADFGLYRGLGPGLAIGIAVTLIGGLTLLPALIAILGRRVMWPSKPRPGHEYRGAWGEIAARVISRPGRTLALGLALFGALALAVLWYTPAGFGEQTAPSGSDSARGQVLLNHFPVSVRNPTNVIMRLPVSVLRDRAVAAQATAALRAAPVFSSITGPANPAGSLAQYISPDGRTLQFYVTLRAGNPASTAALHAIPSVRAAVTRAARSVGATAWGVGGEAAAAYDVSRISSSDLRRIVPVVLVVIALLLTILLRSLVAPLYLIASVGLSYLAALGLAILLFVKFGNESGLNFVLPFFMFVFLMALGEDYNILVMTRIREEARGSELGPAVRRAIAATGGTVTSAGLILAGTFAVLTVAGDSQSREIGLGLAAGVLLDTFLVRTLLIPSLVVLLGDRNWWPWGLGD